MCKLSIQSWNTFDDDFNLVCEIENGVHRAELCNTSGIFTGAKAVNLKDRDANGMTE